MPTRPPRYATRAGGGNPLAEARYRPHRAVVLAVEPAPALTAALLVEGALYFARSTAFYAVHGPIVQLAVRHPLLSPPFVLPCSFPPTSDARRCSV